MHPVELRHHRGSHRHDETDAGNGTLGDRAGQRRLHIGFNRGGVSLHAERTHIQELDQPARRLRLDGRFIGRFGGRERLELEGGGGFDALVFLLEGGKRAAKLRFDSGLVGLGDRDLEDALAWNGVVGGSTSDGDKTNVGFDGGEKSACDVQRIGSACVDVTARMAAFEVVQNQTSEGEVRSGGTRDGEGKIDGEAAGTADADRVFFFGVHVDEVGRAEKTGLELESAEHSGFFVTSH